MPDAVTGIDSLTFCSYPSVLTEPVTLPQMDHAHDWLLHQGDVPTLNLMMRLTDSAIEKLAVTEDPVARTQVITESACQRFNELQKTLSAIDQRCGFRHWSGSISLPYMHTAIVRRPKQALLALMDSDLCGQQGTIASVIPNYVLQPSLAAEGESDDDSQRRRRRTREILDNLDESPNDYLDSLNCGSDWLLDDGESGHRPLSACVLDSGVDESHVALQGQILVHDLYDGLGQAKFSQYSIDRGCHGTKTSGIICARSVSGTDLGIPNRHGKLRLGACPAAKVAVVNVSGGKHLRESTTFSNVLAGMDWAVQNKNHPDWGRYEVVNMSLELLVDAWYDQVTEYMDEALLMMRENRLVPILASGNRRQRPLGTKGVYVGAMDRQLNPLSSNGERVDLFAPGHDLLCCQPPLPQLGSDALSCYSGSSLAAAFTTGAILNLQAKTNRSAFDCINALLSTRSEGRQMNPSRALVSLQ